MTEIEFRREAICDSGWPCLVHGYADYRSRSCSAAPPAELPLFLCLREWSLRRKREVMPLINGDPLGGPARKHWGDFSLPSKAASNHFPRFNPSPSFILTVGIRNESGERMLGRLYGFFGRRSPVSTRGLASVHLLLDFRVNRQHDIQWCDSLRTAPRLKLTFAAYNTFVSMQTGKMPPRPSRDTQASMLRS